MNRYRSCSLLVVLFVISLVGNASAQNDAKSTQFTSAVIKKAVSILPEEMKARVASFENSIVAGALPKKSGAAKTPEPCYFIPKGIGSGPRMLADQFKVVAKNLRDRASDPVIAASMGRLAAYVIALCQPYHTDEAGFASTAHAEFEKNLDEGSASLAAESDGYQRVDNPSQYGIALARKGNALFTRLGTAEPSLLQNELFSAAVNAVADCWVTLLEKPALKNSVSQGSNAPGGYIGNAKSMKFHVARCRFLPGEKNRIALNSRQEAISKGFVPCKICKP